MVAVSAVRASIPRNNDDAFSMSCEVNEYSERFSDRDFKIISMTVGEIDIKSDVAAAL